MISTLLSSIELTLLLSVAALYIVQCPFNKVEESFNTQAVHDIVNLFPDHLPTKTNLSQNSNDEIAIRSHLLWDHMQFPGAVPRTFLGALLVGLPLKLAKQFIFMGYMSDDVQTWDDHDLTAQFVLQIGSRFALSSFLVVSLGALLKAIQKRYGLAYRISFLIITLSQFHYLFYAGRFIPNTFAAFLANLVFASWISRQYSKSIIYIAICVVIFRFDTSIYFGCLLLDGVFIRKLLPLSKVIKVGIPTGLVAILVSFTIDSAFWNRPVWPEFEGFYFNVWLNKSHEWGVQPYTWYFTSCIPRIMLCSGPLLLFVEHKITREYLIPVLAFILTYSFLPHKELRFILFVTPILNMCAASGLLNIYYYLNKTSLYLLSKLDSSNQQASKGKPASYKLSPSKRPERPLSSDGTPQRSNLALAMFGLFLAGMFTANLFACYILTRISSHNYPGGQAALALGVNKELLDAAKKSMENLVGQLSDMRSDAGVYVDNLAAQTGMSRFVQVNGVYYSKTTHLDSSTFAKSYNLIYLLQEPAEVTQFLKQYCPSEKNQEQLSQAEGFDKWARSNNEIRCKLPNQTEMYCSIVDTITTFKSVNLGGLLRQLRQINSLSSAIGSLNDNNFLKLRVALNIIRCSTKSKFSPLKT